MKKLVSSILARKNIRPTDAILFILPFAFLCLCILLVRAGFFPIKSNPLEYDQDPAYVYLYSGLTILHFQIPYHVDHPGTVFQLFLAALTLCTFIVFRLIALVFPANTAFASASLDSFVLQHAELILSLSGLIMSVLITILLFLLAKQIYLSTRSLTASVIAQTFVFSWSLSKDGIQSSGANLFAMRSLYPAPESMLILLVLVGLTLLTPYLARYFSRDRIERQIIHAKPGLIGFAAALGLFTKVTFASFLPLLFSVDRLARKKVWIYFGGTSFIFLIFLSPRVDNFITLLRKFISRPASAARLLPGIGTFESPDNTFLWLQLLPLLAGLTFLLLRYVLRLFDSAKSQTFSQASLKIKPEENKHRSETTNSSPDLTGLMLLSLCLLPWIGFFIKQAKLYYMIPTIMLTHYTVAMLTASVESRLRWQSIESNLIPRSRPWNPCKPIFFIYFFLVLSMTSFSLYSVPRFMAAQRTIFDEKIAADANILAQDNYYCTFRIPTGRCSAAFALHYAPQLASSNLYNNIGYYGIFSSTFEDFGEQTKSQFTSKADQGEKLIVFNKLYGKYYFPPDMQPELLQDGHFYSLWLFRPLNQTNF